MKEISKKTTKMIEIESNIGGDIEEELRKLYVDEGLSVSKIADKLNISYVTVIKWLRLAGIYSRKLNL